MSDQSTSTEKPHADSSVTGDRRSGEPTAAGDRTVVDPSSRSDRGNLSPDSVSSQPGGSDRPKVGAGQHSADGSADASGEAAKPTAATASTPGRISESAAKPPTESASGNEQRETPQQKPAAPGNAGHKETPVHPSTGGTGESKGTVHQVTDATYQHRDATYPAAGPGKQTSADASKPEQPGLAGQIKQGVEHIAQAAGQKLDEVTAKAVPVASNIVHGAAEHIETRLAQTPVGELKQGVEAAVNAGAQVWRADDKIGKAEEEAKKIATEKIAAAEKAIRESPEGKVVQFAAGARETFNQERDKGASRSDAAANAVDKNIEKAPFGEAEKHIENAEKAFKSGDIKGATSESIEAEEAYSSDVIKIVSQAALAMDLAGMDAGPERAAPKPEGLTTTAPEAGQTPPGLGEGPVKPGPDLGATRPGLGEGPGQADGSEGPPAQRSAGADAAPHEAGAAETAGEGRGPSAGSAGPRGDAGGPGVDAHAAAQRTGGPPGEAGPKVSPQASTLPPGEGAPRAMAGEGPTGGEGTPTGEGTVGTSTVTGPEPTGGLEPGTVPEPGGGPEPKLGPEPPEAASSAEPAGPTETSPEQLAESPAESTGPELSPEEELKQLIAEQTADQAQGDVGLTDVEPGAENVLDLPEYQESIARASDAYSRLTNIESPKNIAGTPGGESTTSGWSGEKIGPTERAGVEGAEAGHETEPHPFDPEGAEGQYENSHSERQKAEGTSDQEFASSKLVCPACQGWFSARAGLEGRPQFVADPSGVRVFTPDGRQIPASHPSGTITMPPADAARE